MDGDEDTVIYQDDIATPRDGGGNTYRRGSKDHQHDMSFEEIENT